MLPRNGTLRGKLSSKQDHSSKVGYHQNNKNMHITQQGAVNKHSWGRAEALVISTNPSREHRANVNMKGASVASSGRAKNSEDQDSSSMSSCT